MWKSDTRNCFPSLTQHWKVFNFLIVISYPKKTLKTWRLKLFVIEHFCQVNHPKISQECLALPSCKCARWWGNFGVLERVRARREQIKKLTKIARRDFKSAYTGETRLSRHLARRADDDEYWRIVNFLTDIWRSLHTLRAIELSPFKRPLQVHYFWICCKRFRKKISAKQKNSHFNFRKNLHMPKKTHIFDWFSSHCASDRPCHRAMIVIAPLYLRQRSALNEIFGCLSIWWNWGDFLKLQSVVSAHSRCYCTMNNHENNIRALGANRLA